MTRVGASRRSHSGCSVTWPMRNWCSSSSARAIQHQRPLLDVVDQYVRRQRRAAGHHRPNVQVVNREHAGHARQRVPDAGVIDMLRHAVEQHQRGLTQHANGRTEDQSADQHRQQRIDEKRAAKINDETGGDRCDGSEQVAEDMDQRRPRVEVFTIARQRPCNCDVDRKPDRGDAKYRQAFDRERRRNAVKCLEEDPGDDAQHRERVDEGGDDFDACQAVRVAIRDRAPCDQARREREQQRRGIRHHVPGVGDQRQ